jgi:hypothetical protein
LGLKTKQSSVCQLRYKIDGGRSAWDVSRSSVLFRVKASQAMVFQSGLKTDGGAMTGGARGTIAEVALESS